jgi:hypothetical protein
MQKQDFCPRLMVSRRNRGLIAIIDKENNSLGQEVQAPSG